MDFFNDHAVAFALVCAGIAVLFGLYLTYWLLQQPQGNERMREISGAVQEGAAAYLRKQYTWIAVVAILPIVLIGFYNALGWGAAFGFVIGALLSAAAGFIGMNVAVRSNLRTAEAAREGVPVRRIRGREMGSGRRTTVRRQFRRAVSRDVYRRLRTLLHTEQVAQLRKEDVARPLQLDRPLRLVRAQGIAIPEVDDIAGGWQIREEKIESRRASFERVGWCEGAVPAAEINRRVRSRIIAQRVLPEQREFADHAHKNLTRHLIFGAQSSGLTREHA